MTCPSGCWERFRFSELDTVPVPWPPYPPVSNDAAFPTDSSGTQLPSCLEGYFLVSETELLDPNFRQTVVLIVHHNEDGAFGLVVNRPAHVTLGDVVSEFEREEIGSAATFIGGPVEQQYLFTLHSGLPDHAVSPYSSSPVNGVVFEPVFQALEEYIREEWPATDPATRPIVNFYLGYSGWDAGQLESELEENAWLVIPAEPNIVFNKEPSEGWTEALLRKGGIYRIIAQTGFKPSIN